VSKYRTKLRIVEAEQWFKNGDHSQDNCYEIGSHKILSEGKIVKFYRDREGNGSYICNICEIKMRNHGWIENSLGDGFIVCPGDWIIAETTGEYYLCKPNIFKTNFEKVE
jgi:hypothetical protein